MNILTIGDICGEIGLKCAAKHIRTLKKTSSSEICIVNGENADVLGIKPDQADRLFEAGADVITLGNHTWNRLQITTALESNRFIIRPINFSPELPGDGFTILTLSSGYKLCVVNAIGRCLCEWNADNPFTALDRLIAKKEADAYIIDFHAEATSEKTALGYYLDGRVAAIFGTHTHVQTADNRILPKGTGFISDIGFTGAEQSILGVKIEQSLAHFLGKLPSRYEAPSQGTAILQGAVFTIDERANRCTAVERIQITD